MRTYRLPVLTAAVALLTACGGGGDTNAGGAFSQVNITLTGPGPVSIPLSVLAGNGSPTGAAGDVSSLAGDPSLAPNELFILPIPAPTNTGLLPSTNYTYSVQVTFNGTQTTLPNVTYTTAAP